MPGPTSTSNFPGLLTPTYTKTRTRTQERGAGPMPYAPKFERALRGISHGMKPKSSSLKKITKPKAKKLLDEAHAKNKGQLAALRSL